MPFAAAMSQHPLATHAVGEVVGEVLERLGDRPDAAVVFVTGPFAGALEDIAAAVRSILQPGSLIGATAESVIGRDREVEGEAAISLLAMRFGPPRRYDTEPLVGAVRLGVEPGAGGWHPSQAAGSVPGSTLVVLADPFSFPLEGLVRDLEHRAPETTIVGGFASGAPGPGANRFVLDGEVLGDGAVGLLLPAGLGATAIVSQGGHPVGEPLVVTRSSGTLIEEIAGRPALDVLMAQAGAASPEDRARMARHLHLGVLVDEGKAEGSRGDFVVRGVLGADRSRKAVAVTTDVAVGTTVQFQVRDAASADEDLRELLAGASGDAALVFCSTARGQGLYGHRHHDAGLVSRHVEGGAVAGMFSAGEVGPIGGRHFVHATSVTALLLDDPF